MELFVVLIDDRHADEAIYLFTERQVAIDYARREATSRCSGEEDFKEHEIDCWEYSATYSCEGDSIRVERVVVDAEASK